jgi:hypothetical protein
MATLTYSLLEESWRNGEIDGRGYHPHAQTQTMNHILSRIKAGEVDSFELSKWTALNHQTILQYCRWLESKGLIVIVHRGHGGLCRYSAV